MVSTFALLAIAGVGALAQAVITVLWYRPVGDVPAPAVPVLETVLFAVVFGGFYAVLGLAFRAVAARWNPYGGYMLLVVSTLALVVVLAIWTGRIGTEQPLAQRSMSLVTAAMLWLLPLLVLVL